MLRRLHSLLVTAYLVGGLTLMAATPWADLRATVLNEHVGPIVLETLHGSADVAIEQTYNGGATLRGSAPTTQELSDEAMAAMKSAVASRQLMLGILLFTLGGFIHAYAELRSERPVKITVKKRKPTLLYWLEMKI